ncbi:MAG: peptide chain release factor 3 [Bdellovibrionaceae bacterium]|nr:peptide chain release factor 3 [Pseudobdellovibrionaceae bacterium]MDW8190899.1 peptide chain release factor 3 [Pseudobdellovibrionaceae bacterium]
MSEIVTREIARRRSFAIISHPDAGKTTLTEKLLLQGGVIHEAGEVRGKAGTKNTTSDWMELEKQRGISVTSSVMTFDFKGLRINLLDTPGHKDFSEDTYRVLMAVDSACMLIDVAKGVEERTQKLYEVCRYRRIPIFTFINKLDREGKNPLQLIDEVEQTLQMSCCPLTWPIGIGDRFMGIYHRLKKQFILYDQRRLENPPLVFSYDHPDFRQWWDRIPKDIAEKVTEELDIIENVLPNFDEERFLSGHLSPLTWGSAKQNFGVDIFLDFFVQFAPSPLPRRTEEGNQVDPSANFFSGFVFKIQANMDPRHRDRVAFIRICSGRFERGMKVYHSRLNREIRLTYSNQFLAQDRETLNEAFAGDIIGVTDSGNFAIGDSVSSSGPVRFEPIPRFTPELFCRVTVKDALKRKKMIDAIRHLAEEGAIQLFVDPAVGPGDPILGAVGELQFDVLLFRLRNEYGLEEVSLQRLTYTVVRWPRRGEVPVTQLNGNFRIYYDMSGHPAILLNELWDLKWAEKENPDVVFLPTPF